MEFRDTSFSRLGRYSLGVERASERLYLSVPVTNGIADYEEYYELTSAEYDHVFTDPTAALAFADECRDRLHDDRLIQKPGWNRGVPM